MDIYGHGGQIVKWFCDESEFNMHYLIIKNIIYSNEIINIGK